MSYEISEIARGLSASEKMVLKMLREDGKGDYNPQLTRARKSLCKKGLADNPMALGFGGKFYACVQHPTPLGVELQHYLGAPA